MKKMQKRMLVMAFSATLALSLLFSVLSVLKVSASEEVSQTDLPGETALVQTVQDHLSEPEHPEEKGNVTVTRQAPDLILSNQTLLQRKHGSKFKKFLPSASYNGSYRSELDDNEKKIFDALYQSLVVQRKPSNEIIHVDFQPTIPFDVVYSDPETNTLSIDDLGDIDDAVLSAAAAFFYDCPEAFWVRSFDYIIDADLTQGKDIGKGYVDWIEIDFVKDAYPGAYSEIAAYDAGLSAAVNTIRQTRKNESVYETIKAIHDFVLLNASYDYSALSGSTYTYGYAYTGAPLFTGKGKFVCEGYSKAMKLLCGKFGINCALVSGEGKTSNNSGGSHMWNYVQIGDSWYAIDSTWDDGYANQDGTPCPNYTYFLIGSTTWVKNDKMFSQDHISDGQVMSSPTKFSMVFPPLSESAYVRYIVDDDPRITLTTLGASIRLSEPYGIRFGIQIKRDEALNSVHYIPEFGTLIIPSSTLGDNELTINTPNVRKIKANNIYSQDETQYTYTGVLIKIPQSFFGTNIKGRGYLIYIDNTTGEEHIIYSQTVERSFYWVAQAAYDKYSAIQNPSESDKEILRKLREFLNH